MVQKGVDHHQKRKRKEKRKAKRNSANTQSLY